jgi:hypothetical protein
MEKSIIYNKAVELAAMACQHVEGASGKHGTSASLSWWLTTLVEIGAILHLAQEGYSPRSLSIKLYMVKKACNKALFATSLLRNIELVTEEDAESYVVLIEEISVMVQAAIAEILAKQARNSSK